MSDTERNWAWLTMAIISVIALLMWLSVVIWPAHAFDSDQYMNVDPKIRDWFKAQKSPHGVPCCDSADGHRTAYDMRPDNHYWVPIEDDWYQVPDEAVIYNTGNPVGEAIVWYVVQGPAPLSGRKSSIYIRCFVPGGGV